MTLKIEAGKFYKTREGNKVRALCTDAPHQNYPIVVLDKDGCPVQYPGTGKWLDEDEHHLDLVEEWREPVKVSGWVNVYDDHSAIYLHRTKESANNAIGSRDRIACVYVEGVEQ